MTIKDWEEYKLPKLNEIHFLQSIFNFIENCVQTFESCLIASVHNKCATVVIAIVYMMFKFKWNVHRTLEFIYSRKTDVEITQNIFNSIMKLEDNYKSDLEKKKGILRTDWNMFSNLRAVFKEDQLSKKDIIRFIENAKMRAHKTKQIFFMGEVFLEAEEEASIVNSFVNSLKYKKDEKTALWCYRGGSSEAWTHFLSQ